MEKFIDLSDVPKSKSGKRYNWQKVDNIWCYSLPNGELDIVNKIQNGGFRNE